MTVSWLFILIVCTMYTFQPGGCWVTEQSVTESPVYQPDKELSVDIGSSATLRCCVSNELVGIVVWFKQPNRKKPQSMVTVYKSGEELFYSKSPNPRFQMEIHGNCFNTTILKTIRSDEAMYYCARKSPSTVFGDGTYLKIKETSKPALCDNPVMCEPTRYGNSTYMNTQEKTMLGLGTALGLCALLIFCLICFILKKKKCDKKNASVEDAPGMKKISDAEALNYAALEFSKRKEKSGISEDCVYSAVK